MKWSPIPQPKQVRISLIISLLIASDNSRLVQFLILPLKGKTAWPAPFVSLHPPAAESEYCSLLADYFFRRSFLLSTVSVSQTLRFLKCRHVSIVSLLPNNGDSRYRYGYKSFKLGSFTNFLLFSNICCSNFPVLRAYFRLSFVPYK